MAVEMWQYLTKDNQMNTHAKTAEHTVVVATSMPIIACKGNPTTTGQFHIQETDDHFRW